MTFVRQRQGATGRHSGRSGFDASGFDASGFDAVARPAQQDFFVAADSRALTDASERDWQHDADFIVIVLRVQQQLPHIHDGHNIVTASSMPINRFVRRPDGMAK